MRRLSPIRPPCSSPALSRPSRVLAQPRPAGPAPADVRSQLPEAARKAWDAAKQLADAKRLQGRARRVPASVRPLAEPARPLQRGRRSRSSSRTTRARSTPGSTSSARATGKLAPPRSRRRKNAIAIVQQFVTTIDVTANEPDATLCDRRLRRRQDAVRGAGADRRGQAHAQALEGGLRRRHRSRSRWHRGSGRPSRSRSSRRTRPRSSSVTVGGAPSATVFVDGKDMGPAPFKGELTAERHTIEARAPGFVTVGQTVDVLYKQPMSLVLSLVAGAPRGALEGDGARGGRDRGRRAEGRVGHVGGRRVDDRRAPARRDASRASRRTRPRSSSPTTRRARSTCP